MKKEMTVWSKRVTEWGMSFFPGQQIEIEKSRTCAGGSAGCGANGRCIDVGFRA